MSYLLRMATREERRSLTDRCTVTRGTYPDHAAVETDLPCLIRPTDALGTQEVDVVQGDTVTIPLSTVRVPATADIARNDVVAVTRSDDSAFAGNSYTVVSVNADSWITTRLVSVREQQT